MDSQVWSPACKPQPRTRPADSYWRPAECWLAVALVFLGCLPLMSRGAETNSTPQILFLHLKVTNQTVTLVDSTVRPGVLKGGPAPAPEGLHFELLTADGQSVWKSGVADPTVRRVEYEDPSGNLKSKTVVLGDTEFTIRVPVMPNARRVEFYKLEASATNANAAMPLARKSLGSVALP